jgi:hypothetical protein
MIRSERALIPTFAARLADQLEGAEGPQEGLITPAAWSLAMQLIALEGVRLRPALARAGISYALFRRYEHAEPRLAAHFHRCVRYARRRRWPILTVSEIFEDVARTGVSLKQAVLARGYSNAQYSSLSQMIWRNPDLQRRYLEAKGAQTKRSVTHLLDTDDEILVSRGKSWLFTERNNIRRLQPQRIKRAEAIGHRARRDASLSAEARTLAQARRRAKRRGRL